MDKAIVFVLGAAAGSLLTWKLIEQKYKDLADEEIQSVRDYYKKKDKGVDNIDSDKEIKPIHSGRYPCGHDKDRKVDPEYNRMLDDLGYTEEQMEDLLEDPDVNIEKTDDGYEIYVEPGLDYIEPYVITPEEYGEREDFATKSWTYYADFVLTDDAGEIISDPESIIGNGLKHFGEYEDDSVCVRNENLECDYQIIKYEKTFSEVNGVTD